MDFTQLSFNGFVRESWPVIIFRHQLFDSNRFVCENWAALFYQQGLSSFFFGLFFFVSLQVSLIVFAPTMSFKDNPCRKFQANIFNKSKCQNCFKPRESHLLNDEDLNQVNKCFFNIGYFHTSDIVCVTFIMQKVKPIFSFIWYGYLSFLLMCTCHWYVSIGYKVQRLG